MISFIQPIKQSRYLFRIPEIIETLEFLTLILLVIGKKVNFSFSLKPKITMITVLSLKTFKDFFVFMEVSYKFKSQMKKNKRYLHLQASSKIT